MTDPPALEQRLAEFADRVAALPDSPELAAAEDLVREALAELGRARRRRDGGPQREQKLLRQLFRTLPVPVIVMDPGGTVRRINNETSRLLGSPAGYLIGRAFPLLIESSRRAAFRSRLNAALRSEESAVFETRLAHQGRTHTVRLVLSRLRMPGEPQEMVAAVALPTEVQLPETRDQAGPQDESLFLAAAQRHELLSRLTRLLLDEESLREPVALIRAARLLAAETADWVIADVVRAGVPSRAAVIAPSSHPVARLHREIEGLPPSAAPIVAHVLATRSGIIHEMLTDETLLGGDLLTRMGAGSLVSVPIRTDDEMSGVLTLVRHRDRAPFGLADLGLLEEIGGHLGLALRAQRTFQRSSNAADALRSGVLPRTLPDVQGFETAAVYHPGSGMRAIGGEFYDVFPMPGGWGFVIGSAAGRGEEAASVTSLVRGGVRVLSAMERDPGMVLRKVNDALLAQHTGLFVMAAAGFVRGRKIRLASAGHHPAALLTPDGGVRFTDGGGVPLGFEEGAEPATEELVPAVGETLVLYSDGLVGSRSAAGVSYGEGRLTEVLARCASQAPAAVVKAIEEDHRAFTGDRVIDEITVLTLRRSR
ncbi:SpoIIE family protein phosphatase [Acrocarpospora catenulata]|uniref:SpoIIE family protein phosphatase n=1 Tax=Acrocarpospora catenulata TaxID=2836182 RepID=UPI0027E1177F|nr:SpoIIE family protein phosphatase [Acrocarpospora catenulata]